LLGKRLSLDNTPKVGNPTLPTQMIDGADITVRGDNLGNRIGAIIRFYTVLPEHAAETCRIYGSVEFLRAFMNSLSRATGYFPTQADLDAELEIKAKEGS
jgi:hypothetical protein